MGQIAILNRSGHAVAEWDPAIPKQVDEARVKFDEMLGQGFAAFRTIATAPTETPPASKPPAEQIRKFDPSAQTIFMVGPKAGG